MNRRATGSLAWVEITRRASHGFTLVELMVVVAIIAILLSLLAPALDKAMAAAEQVFCGSAQRTMGMANQQYAMASKRCFVPIKTPSHAANDNATPTNTWAYGILEPWWFNLLFIDLLGGRNSLAHKRTSYPGSSPTDYGLLMGKEITCPSSINPSARDGAVWVTLGFNITGYYFYQEIAINQRQIDRLGKSPGDVLQMIDVNNWFAGKTEADYRAYWDIRGEVAGGNPTISNYRHNEGVNIEFFDGHVEWMHKTGQATYDSAGVATIHPMWDLFLPGEAYTSKGFTHGWIPNPFNP